MSDKNENEQDPILLIDARIEQLIKLLRKHKPGDRSEEDRYWAIAVTSFEKMYAFWKVYIVKDRR